MLRDIVDKAPRVIAGYPTQTVFRLSGYGAGFGNKKSPHNNLNPPPFRDSLGSGSLCSDKKVKNLLRFTYLFFTSSA